jgi:site-specific DNA recombinase
MNAQKGRVPPRIFGYDRIDNFTLEINEEEAKVVKLIYELYIDKGMGSRGIALELSNRNIPVKYGGRWYPKAVRRILTDSIYYGIYENNKYEIVDYIEGKRGKIPKEEHYTHERPEWAIVDKERYDQAKIILDDRRETYKNDSVHNTGRYSNKNMFSNILKCGNCGKSYCRKIYKGINTKPYWKCTSNDQLTSKVCDNNTRVNENDLIEEISKMLKERLEDIDIFKYDLKTEALKQYSSIDRTISMDELKKQREKLLFKKDKYQEMFVNDVISIDDLKKKTSEIISEINNIENQMDDMTGSLTEVDIDNKIIELISDIEKFLELKEIKNIDMRKIVKQVTVYKNKEINIELNI